MANKSFDDIIKSKLDQFRIEAGSDAFEQFVEARTNTDFDQTINNKIGSHQLEVFPNDWDALNQRLEKEGVTNEFDALIGAKLASLASNDIPDWDQFEQLLDNDEAFDSEISEKVKNHTVPSSDNQWPKLSAHLEEVERRRNRIVISKYIEAAIFILFVLTIMQLYPINNIGKVNTVYRTVSVQEDLSLNDGTDLVVQENSSSENKTENEIASSTSTSQGVRTEISPEEFSIESRTSTINLKVADAENTQVNYIAEQIVPTELNLLNKDAMLIVSDLPIAINQIEIESNKISTIVQGSQIKNFEKSKSPTYFNKLAINQNLASLEINPIDFERERYTIPSLEVASTLNKGQYWINTYGAPDVNFISTPYDLHYGTEAYQHGSYGYTIGATVSYERDNWEVESGLAYSSLNYYPFQITEITGKGATGFTETTLKEIIMNIVEIPLNFKYKIFNKNNWSIYANSGLSIGALASTNYDIDEIVHKVFAARVSDSKSNGNKEILKRKEFDPGLLNGGSFQNNIFATLNTGIGVTKKISDGVSFYAQPTYHHNLAVGGLGPNNDVHSRLSVQIGTKVRL